MAPTLSLSDGAVGHATLVVVGELVGTILGGRYAIEAQLGTGAMGTVYRARHVRMGRPFAVKVLHPRLVADPKLMKRFHREAELAGKLQHPNLVSVVDVGESEGLCYLVMELADGPCLVDLLTDAPFPAPRVIALVRQLCDGLQRAHDLGLIHRDFKPENVIVVRDDHGNETPKIVDFGIAILRDEASPSADRLTTAGLVLGTPHYMAPEQAVGAAMDHRVDLFALGVICYEMLTGRMPFEGSGVDVARANLATPTPAMGVRVPTLVVDPLLEAFTAKLLAKRRDRRPGSAREARELVELIEHDRPAAAAALGVVLPVAVVKPPPAAPTRAQPTSQPPPLHTRPPRGLVVAGAIAAVVFIGLVTAAILGGSSDAPPHTAAASAPRTAPTAPRPAPSPRPGPAQVVVSRPDPPSSTPHPNSAPIAASPAQPTSAPVARAIAPPPTAAARPAPIAATAPVVAVTPPSPTAKGVADLYVAVGGELKRYSDARGLDAITDLWSRYRRIPLNDVLTTPARREATTELLLQIRRDLATR